MHVQFKQWKSVQAVEVTVQNAVNSGCCQDWCPNQPGCMFPTCFRALGLSVPEAGKVSGMSRAALVAFPLNTEGGFRVSQK